MNVQEKVHDFLKNRKVGVLSTVRADGSGSQSALVGYAENEKLELVFNTSNSSRKYQNLKANPHVSFVVGFSSDEGSLQYEGIASELSGEALEKAIQLKIAKNIHNAAYVGTEGQAYFRVRPTWIRFLDNAGDPADLYEINF